MRQTTEIIIALVAVLKKKMDALDIRCEVNAGSQLLGGGRRVSLIDFMSQEFGMAQ